MNLEEVARINPEVKDGGRFAPKDCKALQKVAIIIPFRNREEHLKYWLYYLHPILQRQQLDYGVYVINQVRCWRHGAFDTLAVVSVHPEMGEWLLYPEWYGSGSAGRCKVALKGKKKKRKKTRGEAQKK